MIDWKFWKPALIFGAVSIVGLAIIYTVVVAPYIFPGRELTAERFILFMLGEICGYTVTMCVLYQNKVKELFQRQTA